MYRDDFHPIMKMPENAVRLYEIASKNESIDDFKRSIDALDRIAKYTELKLKAVSRHHDKDRVVNVILKRFDGKGSR